MLKHTSFSFRFWLKAPGLAPGGYLIIEDLQVNAKYRWAKTALDHTKANAKQPPIARGTTVVNYAQSLLLCQLSSFLCRAPQAGEIHAMIQYVRLVDQIMVGSEAVAFRKATTFSSIADQRKKFTSDLCIALDDRSGSSFDRKASVLVVRLDGHYLSEEMPSPATAQHLQARLGARGFDVMELRLASCASFSACLDSIRGINATLDLIVVEVPSNSGDSTTWASQQLLLEVLGSVDFMRSKRLAIGGVVMINGYQPRSIAVTKTPDPKSPRTAKRIREPLLAFAADFVVQHLVTVPRGGHGGHFWSAHVVRNAAIVSRAIVYFSDVSIDSHNALYFRRGDPRHNRLATPRDHLRV